MLIAVKKNRFLKSFSESRGEESISQNNLIIIIRAGMKKPRKGDDEEYGSHCGDGFRVH